MSDDAERTSRRRGAATEQDEPIYGDDHVIALVEKKEGRGFQVFLRSITGGPRPVRSVVIRLVRKLPNGHWADMAEPEQRRRVTIAHGLLPDLIRALLEAHKTIQGEFAATSGSPPPATRQSPRERE